METDAEEISIKLYEPWMREQIVALTEKQYPFMQGWFSRRFTALYESIFQNGKNEIITAVTGDKRVVACISYITWPISYKDKNIHAYQMVGLIVDEQLRGKGIFKKVLALLDERMNLNQPEVIIGFPVESSINGFLSRGWISPFNLQWYLKPVSISGILKRGDFQNQVFESDIFIPGPGDKFLHTASDSEFWNLRREFTPLEPTYYKSYVIEGVTIQILFRIHKRAGFNVAVIGKISGGNSNSAMINSALSMWLGDLRKNGGVLLAATAINESCSSESVLAVKQKFFRTKKFIRVILKSYGLNDELLSSENWNLFPADMETW